jgi:predicted lipoprotein with Yx(FWY)xxD motif
MQNHNHSVAARTSLPARWLVATAAVVALLTVFFALPAAGKSATAAGPIISTASTSLGKIVVTSSGRTLYLFAKDTSGKSTCTGQCATFWPPLIASAKPRAGAGARASLLGTTRGADGRMQVTYNHHPLYTFAKDTKKGQTSGEGLSAFGAKWFAVSPAGAKIVAKSAPAPGGGYNGYSPW